MSDDEHVVSQLTVARFTLDSWNDLQRYVESGWLYRGQRSVRHDLRTSVERCCERHRVPAAKRLLVEHELYREFRRNYYHYHSHVPHRHSPLEWLSLMQHHGAPTRLLDFTYSIYVAAYFAIEKADNEDCAVWCVKSDWAVQQTVHAMKKAGKTGVGHLEEPFLEDHERTMEDLFLQQPQVKCICPLNPFRLNERLRTQKGVFVAPGDIGISFVENLKSLEGHDDAANVRKLVIPFEKQAEAMRQLSHMNISRTSLFPGLDGYARSLGIYHPVIFDPARWAR